MNHDEDINRKFLSAVLFYFTSALSYTYSCIGIGVW